MIIDPLQGMRARIQSSLDDVDNFTEEDELTTEDFDSDDGLVDDDFSGKWVCMYGIVAIYTSNSTSVLELFIKTAS